VVLLMSATSVPTERGRFWLDHEAAIKASGTTAKANGIEALLPHNVDRDAIRPR